MPKAKTLAAALLLPALLLPAVALATSRVSRNGNTIRISSGSKPSNITIGSGFGATIEDSVGKIGIGPGCQRLDRHRAFCGQLNGRKVIARLGGGRDQIGTLTSFAKIVAYGGPGNDDLNGGSRDDKIFGGPGNDVIYGGGGNDRLAGGPGRDFIDCDTGFDVAVVGRGDRTEQCEVVRR